MEDLTWKPHHRTHAYVRKFPGWTFFHDHGPQAPSETILLLFEGTLFHSQPAIYLTQMFKHDTIQVL